MTEASEASARASASSAPADGSWRDAFLALLTNDAKAGSSSSVRRVPTVRSRGFTVLVRRAGSLQAMQQTCFEQTWCSCLTFRYRVTSSPVFGTLIAALLADIDRLRRGAPNTDSPSDGIVLPDPLGEEWTSVIQDGLLADSARAAGSPLADPAGEIEPQWLERFLEDLGNEAFSRRGAASSSSASWLDRLSAKNGRRRCLLSSIVFPSAWVSSSRTHLTGSRSHRRRISSSFRSCRASRALSPKSKAGSGFSSRRCGATSPRRRTASASSTTRRHS